MKTEGTREEYRAAIERGLGNIRKAIEDGLHRATWLDPHDDEGWIVDAAMSGIRAALSRSTEERGPTLAAPSQEGEVVAKTPPPWRVLEKREGSPGWPIYGPEGSWRYDGADHVGYVFNRADADAIVAAMNRLTPTQEPTDG